MHLKPPLLDRLRHRRLVAQPVRLGLHVHLCEVAVALASGDGGEEGVVCFAEAGKVSVGGLVGSTRRLWDGKVRWL